MAEENGTTTQAPETTKTKKLSKTIAGNILTIVEGKTNTSQTFDFGSLPADIQAKLGPYGLSQKLGDAAAGKEGQEAVTAIKTVWEGLASGNWSVRAPAGEKVSKKDMEEKLNAMSPEDKAIAEKMLASMGITFGAKPAAPAATDEETEE